MTLKNISKILILLLVAYQALGEDRCTDKPSCFVKKLFDFTYPKEKLYSISLTQSNASYTIKGYGDFNNDLMTDYAAIDQYGNILTFIFNRNDDIFSLANNFTVLGCQPTNLYLYDLNGDNLLDLTIWGIEGTQNCLVPYLQNGNELSFNTTFPTPATFQTTTNPTLIDLTRTNNGDSLKNQYLILYDTASSSRTILTYKSPNTTYIPIAWGQLFVETTTTPIYTSIPFADPHWNSFLDITNDCNADFVVTNSLFQIQFWIYSSSSQQYFLHSTPWQLPSSLTSFTFNDINYDGAVDLIYSTPTQIIMHLNSNPLTFDSQFCVSNSMAFSFNLNQFITVTPPDSYGIPVQVLHMGDINIDGFPDMLVMLSNAESGLTVAFAFKNEEGNSFTPFTDYYNNVLAEETKGSQVVSVSFLDILENGIIDIVLVVNSTGNPSTTRAFYNNYLYQNYFYIKGYGVSGAVTSNGAQLTGVSFYWLNSIGSNQKVAYQAQIIQTAYDALAMPYAVSGLGRANNYVESFTIGRNGISRSWSPIIPNSQLAIFTGSSETSSWGIKIFVMPTEALVYVIIVSAIILVIFGTILVYFKCKKHKAENQMPLVDI